MELKTINKDKGILEIQATGMDEGLAHYISKKTLDQKIGFAAISLDHPLTGNPIFHVQDTNPKEALNEAAKEAEKELTEAEQSLEKINKK